MRPHSLTNPENHTCFAALFLLRSTRSRLKRSGRLALALWLGAGPAELRAVRIQGGKVVSSRRGFGSAEVAEQIDDDNEEEYVKAIGAVSNCRRRKGSRLTAGGRLRELAGGTAARQARGG